MTTTPIRIRLIEEVCIQEAGLRALLEQQPDFHVDNAVSCKQSCDHPCDRDDFDIMLMTINFGSCCDLECIRRIMLRDATTRIIALCMIEDIYLAKRMLNLGVKGVLCPHSPPTILFRAIRAIANGGTYIDTDIARQLAALSDDETSPFDQLSNRELEIVRLLLNGLNQTDIGAHLYISPHTVANHHTNILKKLHVRNHIELTKLAIRHNITSI